MVMGSVSGFAVEAQGSSNDRCGEVSPRLGKVEEEVTFLTTSVENTGCGDVVQNRTEGGPGPGSDQPLLPERKTWSWN
jgi:hypothetical protein